MLVARLRDSGVGSVTHLVCLLLMEEDGYPAAANAEKCFLLNEYVELWPCTPKLFLTINKNCMCPMGAKHIQRLHSCCPAVELCRCRCCQLEFDSLC
jgi:hypothetical protein